MSTVDKKRQSDGFISLEQGVDSGRAPNLIGKNQAAWAVNTTFRGGWPLPRPGWIKRALSFTDEDVQTAFEDTLFQCGDGYVSDVGSGAAISMHGGRVFKINISNFAVQDISLVDNNGVTDYNNPNLEQASTQQAENYFIIQNGAAKPFIHNGASSRRAVEGEIPTGKQMAYYMGRIWVANGRNYVAGDIIYGPSGTEALNNRDSILKMTENKYLAEGGSFGVPSGTGDITALVAIANINTALGQGELITFTTGKAFATLVPQDRSTWKNTTQPLQRVIQLSNGAYAQASVVNVNEDLFYRSDDGIRSLAYAVRNSGQWGNVPISSEASVVLDKDAKHLLKFGSGVNFENRMLMTCSPTRIAGHGTYHRAKVILDFDLITTLAQKSPPAWEGIWTGLNFLKVFTVYHQEIKRCFAYVLNSEKKIELWELTIDAQNDNNGSDVRIQWSFDTRSMDFGSKFDSNELFCGDIFIDRLSGSVDFDIDYRPDSYPCWKDWDSWSECARNSICPEDITACMQFEEFQERSRPNHQLLQPADEFSEITKHRFRVAYEFQFRFNILGFCRVKQSRFNTYQTQQLPYGDNTTLTSCPTQTCCLPNPYEYSANGGPPQ